MGLILPRNPLAFPSTRATLNGLHPMARGARYAGVAAPSGAFINLLTGQPSTATGGALSSKVSLGLGLGVVAATSTRYATIPNFFSDIPTAVTFAVIFTQTVNNSSTNVIFSTNPTTNTGSILFAISALNPLIQNNGSNYGTLLTVALNTPYFLALSFVNGSSKNNGVLANLITGQVKKANTIAGPPTITAGSTSWSVGYVGAGQQPNATIAAVAYSINNFLSFSQLLQWAQAPWDYWYSPVLGSVLSMMVGGSAAPPPIDLAGNLGGVSQYG